MHTWGSGLGKGFQRREGGPARTSPTPAAGSGFPGPKVSPAVGRVKRGRGARTYLRSDRGAGGEGGRGGRALELPAALRG